MKKMKKLASLALALVMALALAVPSFAAEGEDVPSTGLTPPTHTDSGTSDTVRGTIGIQGAVKDVTYSIYKIFELESFDTTVGAAGAYTYKVTANWKPFFTTGAGAEYVTINDQDYVEVNVGDKLYGVVDNSSVVAELAEAALAYAKNNNIAATSSEKATNGGLLFQNVELGYYLVDSSAGALCSLDTTNRNVAIKEKNEIPTIDKEVTVPDDTAIGDAVTYDIVVPIVKGAQGYIVSDTMGEGLTYNNDLKVMLIEDDLYSDFVNVELSENVTLTTPEYSGKAYTAQTVDGKIFSLAFDNSFLTATEGYSIYITYSATINEKALLVSEREDGDGNTWNQATLNYGDDQTVVTDKHGADVNLYKFELVKTNSSNEVITGAKFELYDDMNHKIPVVKVTDGVYRVATAAEVDDAEEIEAGRVQIKGLSTGTYILKETVAPNGYNKLAEDVTVTIGKIDNMATFTEDGKFDTTANTGVGVVNLTGAELPSTGGIGTTMFYVVGGLLVAGAGVLLVTKKRMGE